MYKNIGFIVLAFLLISCGGGGSSSTSDNASTERDLAAASSGATVAATYDSDSATNVIDRDVSRSLFWSANITGDNLTIDFGKIVNISHMDIYTNEFYLNSFKEKWMVELSQDGFTWKRTMVLGLPDSDFLIVN